MLNDDLVMASRHIRWLGGCSPDSMQVPARGDDACW